MIKHLSAAVAAALFASSASAATMVFDWENIDWPDAMITGSGTLETDVESGSFTLDDVISFSFSGKVSYGGEAFTFSYDRADLSDLGGHIEFATLSFGGVEYLHDADASNIGTLELIANGSTIGGSASGVSEDMQPISGMAWVTGVTASAAVPEPASWAMMVGGFGLIGGAMRRRQKLAVRFA